MPLYESTFIARHEMSTQQVEGLADTFTNIIKESGGEVSKTEHWGLRNLAYRIKKNRKGQYVFFNIDAPSAAIQEYERNMRLSEDVLRYLTVRVDKLDPDPSPIMQSRAPRDDRSRRGGQYGGRPRSHPADAPAAQPAEAGKATGDVVKKAEAETPAKAEAETPAQQPVVEAATEAAETEPEKKAKAKAPVKEKSEAAEAEPETKAKGKTAAKEKAPAKTKAATKDEAESATKDEAKPKSAAKSKAGAAEKETTKSKTPAKSKATAATKAKSDSGDDE